MTSQEMLDALSHSGVIPPCTCGRSVSYIGETVTGAIYTLGCPRCRMAIDKCPCERLQI